MDKTTGIEFTQYKRPNGRKCAVRATGQQPEIEAKAREMQAAGWRFETEVLMDSNVSFTIERDEKNEEIEIMASQLVPNGPAVTNAVRCLIETAYKRFSPSTQK